jgi:hypothetical protein
VATTTAARPSIPSAKTDITTRSARLRVDAPVLASFAGFGFSPDASYSVTQTNVEAYTENGGGLPGLL